MINYISAEDKLAFCQSPCSNIFVSSFLRLISCLIQDQHRGRMVDRLGKLSIFYILLGILLLKDLTNNFKLMNDVTIEYTCRHSTNWIRTNIKLLSFLVDREWVCRPPHYSPPKINSISSEYILPFHLRSPMHSQYYSPNHGY